MTVKFKKPGDNAKCNFKTANHDDVNRIKDVLMSFRYFVNKSNYR